MPSSALIQTRHALNLMMLEGAVYHAAGLLQSPDPATRNRLEKLAVELCRHSFDFPVPIQSIYVSLAKHEPGSHGHLSGLLYQEVLAGLPDGPLPEQPAGVFALVHGGALPASNLAVGPYRGRDPLRAVRAKAIKGGAIDSAVLKRNSSEPVTKAEFQAAVELFHGAFPGSFQIWKSFPVTGGSGSCVRRFANTDRAILAHVWDSLCDSLDVAVAAASATEIAVITDTQL